MTTYDKLAVQVRRRAPMGVEVAAVVAVRGGRVGGARFLPPGVAGQMEISPAAALAAVLSRGAADGWVLLHRHARSSAPSPADLAVTRRLVAASAVVGLPLRAHLVVGPADWTDCLPLARLQLATP